MSIDSKIQFPSESQQPEQVSTTRNTSSTSKGAARSSGISPGRGEDTVSISSTHGEVQALTAGLSTVPEVRSGRVDALRAQVEQGSYQPASAKVADAIVKEYGKYNAQS